MTDTYSIYQPSYNTGDFPQYSKLPFYYGDPQPIVVSAPRWIHPVYPQCNCPHCREVRGDPPKVPALRPEDV